MSRDPAYEHEFLGQVTREARRRYGVDVAYYDARVQHRLAVGAERYGNQDFLGKDVIAELLDETPDVGAYAVLEAQKQLASSCDESNAHHLFEAAVHGAMADWHGRQARRREEP